MLHANHLVVFEGPLSRRRLLDDVCLSLIGGEHVVLLGASGAGKSVLLQTLAGTRAPSRGDVWMGGRPLHRWSAAERACRRALWVQGGSTDLPLTALQLVLLGRAPHATSAAADREVAEAALGWVGLSGCRDRPLAALTHGERRLLELARLLAQVWGRAAGGDCYVLLDDPLAGLDMVQQHRAMAVARQLAAEGAAVLTVTHDLNLAARYGQRLLLMAAGRILADGPPERLLVPSLLARTFGVDATWAYPRDGGAPVLGIRPAAAAADSAA